MKVYGEDYIKFMYILNNMYLELNTCIISIESFLKFKILRFNFSTPFINFFMLFFTACIAQR